MKRFAVWGVALFLAGVGLGVLWSPMHRGSSKGEVAKTDFSHLVAEAEEQYGKEVAEFVAQFKDLHIVMKREPFLIGASTDGRFVIRSLPNNDLVVSELRYPMGKGELDHVVRNYELLCQGKKWFCTFARSADGTKLLEIHYGFRDNLGHGLTYVDSDADGKWDRLIEETPQGFTFYRWDGMLWRESTPKELPAPPKEQGKREQQ
ncbi:hypothetical protein [Thermopirellula anaerolimosa]